MVVRDEESGKVVTRLVKLDWPIARIPSLAPHFGIQAEGQANRETRMVPIIGLDNSEVGGGQEQEKGKENGSLLGGVGSFASTQPERLVRAIAGEMGIEKCMFCNGLATPPLLFDGGLKILCSSANTGDR